MISAIGVNDCFEIFVHVRQPQFGDETIVEVHNAYHCGFFSGKNKVCTLTAK